MDRPSQVVVLVEDERQQRFVRRYLYRLGFVSRDIRFEPLPAGKGSGAQWDLDRYSRAVIAYRSKSARAMTALVVAIDADNGTVAQRQEQFRDRTPRSGDDRIVHLIPKWSIETWIRCLSGSVVDEDQTYRHAPKIDEQIGPAAATYFEWSRPNASIPGHCALSLMTAVPEVRRLE